MAGVLCKEMGRDGGALRVAKIGGDRPPLQDCRQIAQRIFWPIQSKNRQTGLGSCFPIALWIVSDVKALVRP